jgi:hypothetical protein
VWGGGTSSEGRSVGQRKVGGVVACISEDRILTVILRLRFLSAY